MEEYKIYSAKPYWNHWFGEFVEDYCLFCNLHFHFECLRKELIQELQFSQSKCLYFFLNGYLEWSSFTIITEINFHLRFRWLLFRELILPINEILALFFFLFQELEKQEVPCISNSFCAVSRYFYIPYQNPIQIYSWILLCLCIYFFSLCIENCLNTQYFYDFHHATKLQFLLSFFISKYFELALILYFFPY